MPATRGNAMTEYGLILALVAVLGITSLTALGEPIAGLFTGSAQAIDGSGLSLSSGSQSNNAGGGAASNGGSGANGGLPTNGQLGSTQGYYQLSIDPATGQPVMRATDGATGQVSNATSVDGNTQWNMVGSVLLANSMETLAVSQSDPRSSEWLSQMAKLGYYLGGSEGTTDHYQVTPFDSRLGADQYTVGNAVGDITTYQQQLQQLMGSPPPSLSQQDTLKALSLATDTYNIAQSYVNKLPASTTQGTAQPYDQLLDLDTLKNDSKAALASNGVPVEPVKITLSNAAIADGGQP